MCYGKTAIVCAAVAGGLILIDAVSPARAAVIDLELVGNPGNSADTTGYGAVSYQYNIGKYEVTAGQYTAFLNAVAKEDLYGLYNADMEWDMGSGITRSGSSGNYTYQVNDQYANRPINYVSWGDAARFANWMHNNQPTGAQGSSTTEDGSYYLNGATSDAALQAVTRKPTGTWFIPTENEWYKAAYYDPALGQSGGYYAYPTSNNQSPGRDLSDSSGNNANYTGDPYPIMSNPDYYTTIAGQFHDSDSPYKTFDQGGNVAEWTEAIASGDYRILRGGALFNDVDALESSARDLNLPSDESYGFGFRIVQVPEPSTLTLLALGGLALRQRRRIPSAATQPFNRIAVNSNTAA